MLLCRCIVWVRHVKSTLVWCAEACVRSGSVLCSVLCQRLAAGPTALVSSDQSPRDIMTPDSHTFYVHLALCGLRACVSALCAHFSRSFHVCADGGAPIKDAWCLCVCIFIFFFFASHSVSTTDCRLGIGRIRFHQFRAIQGLEWRHKDIHPNPRQSMRNAGGNAHDWHLLPAAVKVPLSEM